MAHSDPKTGIDFLALVEAEERDTPKDCHIHCMCWDHFGKCCDCGDTRFPLTVSGQTQPDGFFDEDDVIFDTRLRNKPLEALKPLTAQG